MNANLIPGLCFIWLPALMCAMLINLAKFKKNIAVGVTFPYEGRNHPAVTARLKKFKTQELLTAAVLTATGIPCSFGGFSARSFTLLMCWVLAVVIVPYIPFVLCNRDLKRIKEENGWKRQQSEQVTVDLSAVPQFKWLSPMVFAPALVLSLLPLLWERTLWMMYLMDAAFVVLFWLGYRYLFRQKSEQVDDNTKLTQALTRIRQCQWGKMWLLCAYAMGTLNMGISLTAYSYVGTAVLSIVFLVVLCSAAMYIEFRTRKLQETLTAQSGTGFYVDDDDKWLGGVLYYNPNDNRLLINDRVGTNSTINLAKPAGKLICAATAVLLLSMPIWGMFIGGDELSITLTETELQVSDVYTIPLEDIEEVTLLTEMPQVARVFGTGMPTYLEGRFNSPDLGNLRLCLDPTMPPYLLIKTHSEQYLFGTRDGALLQEVYEAIK